MSEICHRKVQREIDWRHSTGGWGLGGMLIIANIHQSVFILQEHITNKMGRLM